MKQGKQYYGFKNNKTQSPYEKYTPSAAGRIALGITVPFALVAFISVIIAFVALPEALLVTIVTFAISFVGSIVIVVDIIVFNQKQKNKITKKSDTTTPDIVRIIHMLVGIGVGIIIGYLIWGVK